MYARVTTFKFDPARLGEIPDKFKEMTPAARTLPGAIDVYAAWRADGQGSVTAIYKSKADADAAAARIQGSGAACPVFSTAPPARTSTIPWSTWLDSDGSVSEPPRARPGRPGVRMGPGRSDTALPLTPRTPR